MKDKIVENFFYWTKMIVLASVIVFLIRGFVFIPMKVDGNSMAKTLKQDDQLVYEKFSEIKRFDVIIFKQNDGATYIKRVIGMPGERIQYIDDELFVNEKIVDEEFLGQAKIKRSSNQYTTNFDTLDLLEKPTISEDAYFVLGDNRRLSKDSRSFGEVKKSEVIGKAVMVYYPIKHFKLIK
ncbi:signal peptidase I [Vagococcus intermedius]|uniref:Signal peptidase I n=1 Tax=Vagococcus intermedius TaxID=2991418 RepID=A0AAF0CWI5_9ENTE|nr:signal peptidase I [Vagococcus intermedius]WEG74168.1 signal peptidase I [Vagococcus intermedius]WEG76248.1 signal peptidase I [Vagococcus intermedius]